MKKIAKILILLFVIGGLVYVNDGIKSDFAYGTVQTVGNLRIDFHVPKGKPIFKLSDMKPGDRAQRKIDVKNKGNVKKKVYVSGIRKGGIGLNPKIETALRITIKDGSTALYGPKKLSKFFSDSQSQNGILLNTLNPSKHKTYKFQVRFPRNSGNEFQEKSVIFDLRFFGKGEHSPRDDDDEDEDEGDDD